MAKSFDEIVPETGFLVDSQIRDALTQGYLIEKGTWDESQIRHASYQLRLGERVEIARAKSAIREGTKELSIVKLSSLNDTLELRPGDTALLYSGENIKLPNSVLGFTVARGLLFVESLVPENTYIDPGFTGTLYTTVTNVSGRVIHLKYQTPIARMFLFKLSRPVASSYSTGAAMGISQELASVPASSIPTQEDARNARTHVLLEEISRIPFGGVHLAESISRCRSREDWILVFSFVWPIVLLFFNTNGWIRGGGEVCVRRKCAGRFNNRISGVPWGTGFEKVAGRMNSNDFTALSRQQFRRYFQPSRLVLCVLPGPTQSGVNVFAVSFNMYCSYKPPMMAMAVHNINRSWDLIRSADEYVLSVPGESMAYETLQCGIVSLKEQDKVQVLNLELCPSERVRVPGLKRAIANVELRKFASVDTGDHSLVVGEVLRFGVNTDCKERPLISVGPDTQGYRVLAHDGIHRIAVVDRASGDAETHGTLTDCSETG